MKRMSRYEFNYNNVTFIILIIIDNLGGVPRFIFKFTEYPLSKLPNFIIFYYLSYHVIQEESDRLSAANERTFLYFYRRIGYGCINRLAVRTG